MDVIVERCAGLDVHRDEVVAMVLVGGRKVKKELRKFGTTMGELVELRAWLREHEVTHVAMEATGVYWLPVLEVLEGLFEIVVANAHHVKNVPGRKTDANDAEWLAMLLRHGLLKKSFVPPPWQRGLRQLTRTRRNLVHSATHGRNQVLKHLESLGIKLASVMSDVFGVSGLAILRELARGNHDIGALCELLRGSLNKKAGKVRAALEGRTLSPASQLILSQGLERLDLIERQIGALDICIGKAVEPYRDVMARLCGIYGVDRNTAAVILAEVGPDVDAFASSDHFAAWSGSCPGNHRSASSARKAAVRKGNTHLLTALVQAALSIVRDKSKPSYLKDKYRRLASRRGHKRAIVAIAHKLAVAIYHMLRDGTEFTDLGPGFLDKVHSARATRRHIEALRAMGYAVTLANTEAATVP